ncbi:MAG: hypothetical protein ACRD1U_00475 [Vicinamibacterales bacterium]
MNRWVGALAIVMVILVSVFGRDGEAPAAQQQKEARPSVGDASRIPSHDVGHSDIADSVRLSHELIEVRIPTRATPRPRAVAPPRSPRAESRRPRFVERARRVLVGDGRYRPEPFPRPKTQ